MSFIDTKSPGNEFGSILVINCIIVWPSPPFFSFIVECVFLFWVGRSGKEKKTKRKKTKVKLEEESGARRSGVTVIWVSLSFG